MEDRNTYKHYSENCNIKFLVALSSRTNPQHDNMTRKREINILRVIQTKTGMKGVILYNSANQQTEDSVIATTRLKITHLQTALWEQ